MPNLYCMRCGAENYYRTAKPYSCHSCNESLGTCPEDVGERPAPKPAARAKRAAELPPERKPAKKRRRAVEEEDDFEEGDGAYAEAGDFPDWLDPRKGVTIEAGGARRMVLRDTVDGRKPNVSNRTASEEEVRKTYERVRESMQNKKESIDISL